VFEGRAAIGYDRSNDTQKYYLGLALDLRYVEGFVEGCLERMGEDEALFRDLWEDEGERETVLTILQAECEVLPGRPEDYLPSLLSDPT
jgi:vacuolar-type H+-ATPase subunit C/Vma6